MNTGMLWYAKAGPLDMRIREAVIFFRRKFKVLPQWVMVNPTDLQDHESGSRTKLDQVRLDDGSVVDVKPFKSILTNHLWVGSTVLEELVPQANVVVAQSRAIQKRSRDLVDQAEGDGK